jgi:EmrB/QacA subfamily drug resistance transporter
MAQQETVAGVAPEQAAAPPVPRFPPGTVPVVAGLMLSMFLVALDATVVSTAMPSIVADLGGFSLYAWVPAVYLLSTAVTTPIYGKLADLFGRKPILFAGIGLFIAGSVTSGAAPNMLFLILARALQGLGAGAVQPVTVTIIGDLFSLEQRARIQGFFSSVWGVSSVIGPLVGGLFVDNVGWRWIFYINLPFGALAVVLISATFHEHATHRRHELDIRGATLMAAGLSAILLFLIEGGQAWDWISAQSGGLLLVTAVTLVLFLRQEAVAAEPALPLDLYRSRIIAVCAIGTFFAGIVLISVSFEVPLFVQGVLGSDALHAGVALAPMSVGWPLAGAISGRLAIRYGYRATAVVGMVCDVVGVALLLTVRESSSFLLVSGYCFLVGIGLGLCSTPMLIAVQSAVSWSRRGVATATNMFVRSFGSVVGLAIMGAIINHVAAPYGRSSTTNQALDIHARRALPPGLLRHIHDALFSGVHAAFVAALVAAIVGVLVAAQLPGGSAVEHEAREEAPA